MSALTCGCDPEAFWVCEYHRKNTTPKPKPALYASLYSALCDASNSVGDVLADIPAGPQYDAYRLLWARLDKSIDETMGRLQALEAHDARALADE